MSKKEKWVVAAKKADFAAIAEKFGIDQVTARLIRNRNVIGMDAVQEYLHGTLSSLHDPGSMKGCTEAAELLLEKIRKNRKIRIIGDYDIDGVCSTYLFYRAICACGGEEILDYEIPDRRKDGYGLNRSLVTSAAESKVDTILTCDNGIAAIDEVSYAKECGMTVIVTDHHEPFETLPDADVVVNPHQPGCAYPYKELCGAAVVWKVICELYRLSGHTQKEADDFLSFVAFATVGDVMDLTGENRILVREGLKRLHRTENPGLRALIQVNDLDPAQITSYHLGYILGPCVNASGRLDTAKLALRLFLADDRTEAEKIACRLKSLNDERKSLTEKAAQKAFDLIESDPSYQKDRVLVVYLPDCTESIAGIVAGRLRERYYKPSFVITDAEDAAKGSGRSIASYSMFEELVKCQDLFLKFGGHPMAAGFSLEKTRIPEMRRRLNENCTLREEDLTDEICIDVPMPIDYISEKVVEELSYLEPFGKGNEKPLFADRSLRILSARVIGKNRNTVKMKLLGKQGTVMDALYFGDPEEFQETLAEKYGQEAVRNLFWGRDAGIAIDITYYPSINEYRGVRSLQITVQNYR